MDPLDHLKQLGGVARTGQLLAAGYSRTDLHRLAKAGVRPVQRGVLALPQCRPEFAAALTHNARVTCASAAEPYGLWLRRPPAQHHLACNYGHGSGFIRHRTIRFDPHPTLPPAAIEDVVLHAITCLAPAAGAAIATSAIRRHVVPLELLKSPANSRQVRPGPPGAARVGPAGRVDRGGRRPAPVPRQRDRLRRPGLLARNRPR
jgi:hypothetical protein